MLNFRKLNVINPLIRASTESGFGRPTEIQKMVIPKIIAKRDVFGCVQNDAKKNAAFVIPMIQLMKKTTVDNRNIRVLIITSSAGNADNIDETFNLFCKYLPLSKFTISDDEAQGTQIYYLKKGREILIATPERLLDLMKQGHADFSKLEMLLIDDISKLDELNLLEETSEIVERLPVKRQNVLFTDKVSRKVKQFAGKMLFNPAEINIPTEFSLKPSSVLPVVCKETGSEIVLNPFSKKTGTSFAF